MCMTTTTSFYAERYKETISVLKEHNLWDLEFGMLFLPVIQHCMPPASLYEINDLLDNLVSCEIDTDWAPLQKTKRLKKKISQIIKIIEEAKEAKQAELGEEAEAFEKNKEVKEEKEVITDFGTIYPITLGIQRISNLKLNKSVRSVERIKMIKRKMIIMCSGIVNLVT